MMVNEVVDPGAMAKSSICCDSEPLDAVRKLESPEYVTTIVCGPVVSDDTVNEATPFTSAPVPIGVAPSRNVTVPLGVLTADETVAVNVVGLLSRIGFAELASETTG